MRHPTVCALLAAVVLAPAAAAQRAPDSSSTSAAQSSLAPATWGIWLAATNDSPFFTRTGVKLRDFYQVAVRYEKPLLATPGMRLDYLLDLVPAAMSTNDPVGFDIVACGDSQQCYAPHTRTVYAAGLSPIGLAIRIFPDSPVSLQISGTAGALLFTRAIPDPLAGAFNFTAAAGLSAAVDLGHGFALDLGILGHHTSNGGTARANPGLNARMFTVGVAKRRP